MNRVTKIRAKLAVAVCVIMGTLVFISRNEVSDVYGKITSASVSQKSLQFLNSMTIPKSEKSHTPEFLEQPNSCLLGETIPQMVLLVSSRPRDFDMRSSIRETWGITAASCGIKVIFGFGNHGNLDIQHHIMNENLQHGDILQSNLIKDGYRSQTDLVMFFFAWAVKNCDRVKLIAKGDDDTWTNFRLLMPVFQSLTEKYTRFVAGFHFKAGTSVIRNPEHEQSLTKSQRFEDFYPEYASGTLYIFPAAMIPVLLKTANELKSYWIDDAFLTGTL